MFTFRLQLTYTQNDGQLFQKDQNIQVQHTYNQVQNNIFLTFHVDVVLMFEIFIMYESNQALERSLMK